MNTKVIVPRFGDPEVLELQESAIPKPTADEIIIRTVYIGVGAIDTIMREGGLKQANLQPPFTPGIEVSGIVYAVGTDVANFQVGQLVAAIMLPEGGYAAYVRAKAGLCTRLTSDVQLPAAASIVNLVTAYLLLAQLATFSADDSLLIHGASGGLGTACVQVARALQPNAQLTTTVRNSSKKEYVSSLGCRTVLTTEEFSGAIREQSYSLIIDPVGGSLRRESLAALRPYGQLFAVGNVSDDYESSVSSQQLWLEGKTIRGFNLALFASLYADKMEAAMRYVVNTLASEELAPTPAKIFGFTEVQEAHRYLQNGTLRGRVLLKCSS